MENTLAKIAITQTADEALVKALERVNTGFDGGRVTKSDLASWFMIQSSRELTEASVTEIHQAHFNQVLYLESLVKKLKSSGRENLDSREMSVLQTMFSQKTTKRRMKLPNAEAQKTDPTEAVQSY